MSEQRYQAVLAVIKDGETVVSVAARFGVSRKTMHQWLARYEADGLEGLADRSHRPRSSPLQMPAAVEVALVDLRRRHPSWGPRRLVYELRRAGVEPVPSESGAYRALLSRRERAAVQAIAAKMTYVELSADNTFYDAFTSALFLPHTELNRFPSVAALAPGNHNGHTDPSSEEGGDAQ